MTTSKKELFNENMGDFSLCQLIEAMEEGISRSDYFYYYRASRPPTKIEAFCIHEDESIPLLYALQTLIKEEGFQIESIDYTNIGGEGGTGFEALLFSQKAFKRQQALMDQFLHVPMFKETSAIAEYTHGAKVTAQILEEIPEEVIYFWCGPY